MTRKDAERQEAIGRLREWLKPGDTVYCVLRHVSRSGMQRSISFLGIEDGRHVDYTYNVGKALDYRFDQNNDGLKVTGCGMDMGFHVVYNLGRALFPDGFDCIGEERRCPSNDHSNRENNAHHKDGGYALLSRWI